MESIIEKDDIPLRLISGWVINFTDGVYQLDSLQFCCDLCYKVQYFTNQIYNPVSVKGIN